MSNPAQNLLPLLEGYCLRVLPRILTQACRDPSSRAFGCFDRNWWHYKVRDFPSIILQQAGGVAAEAARMPRHADESAALRELARGSARFWAERAQRHGAFEEYYPWERGYPPLAFSTLGTLRLVDQGLVGAGEVLAGVRVAARQLASRFEAQAANQQVAGHAALCLARKHFPALVDPELLRGQRDRTLALQHGEGWYMEYGGPDLGYLSVTMDCLWDAFDATGDPLYVDSARRALAFIASFVATPWRGAGMHNARNTDYLVPYGIARCLADPSAAPLAAGVLRRLYEGLGDEGHFLRAVDDRYLCHYTGVSLFRALGVLARHPLPAASAAAPASFAFAGSGHHYRAALGAAPHLLVSLRKGGAFSARGETGGFADFGWAVERDGVPCTSHWWSAAWHGEPCPDGWVVRGHLVPVRDLPSTPLKHLLLRAASFLLGNRIIGLLKGRLIFREAPRDAIPFERRVRVAGASVEVVDTLGVADPALPRRAPRASLRHVASADSWHEEDFLLARGWDRTEKREVVDGTTRITTTYSPRR